jgi:hypothetical protein
MVQRLEANPDIVGGLEGGGAVNRPPPQHKNCSVVVNE